MENTSENYAQHQSLEPPIVVKTYRTLLLFAPLSCKFPKLYRHTLGQTVQNNLLNILQLVCKANALPAPLREMPLVEASATCELLKILLRICLELDCLVNTQYFQLSADLQEIGKMIGGWINYVRTGKNRRQ